MRLFELEDDNMKGLGSLPVDSSSFPPLPSLSVTSDDSSSVSSVSLEDDESSSSRGMAVEKRSIFGSYWKKKGGRPKTALHATNESSDEFSIESNVDEDDEDGNSNSSCSLGANTYEKTLLKNEEGRRSSLSGGGRRRIWANVCIAQSEPSLPTCIQTPLFLRKTQSAAVVGQKRQSCLRKCRYSGAERRQEPRKSAGSVSFNDEVKVEYLKPTSENWAARGWSTYFM